MKKIDLSTWKRSTHYAFFKDMDYPYHNICTNLDITHFLKTVKQKGLPFYYSMLYAAAKALNTIEEFRYRICGDDVILYDRIHPSFTELDKDTELFKIVTVEITDTLEEFVSAARKTSDKQTEYFKFENAVERADLIYFSCIPWITITSVSHPISLSGQDGVPRVTWGKYFKSGDKVMLPFSVQSHHSFVDGLHVGKYIECLQTMLDEIS